MSNYNFTLTKYNSTGNINLGGDDILAIIKAKRIDSAISKTLLAALRSQITNSHGHRNVAKAACQSTGEKRKSDRIGDLCVF